jgi:hypothetical protein
MKRRRLVRAVVASTIGTTIEWYDTTLYGLLVPFYIGPLFFPSGDAVTSALAGFSSLLVSFAFRPVPKVGIVGAIGVDWLAHRAMPQSGTATVVYHSLMRASGPTESVRGIEDTIWQCGQAATPDAPFAHLRFEAAEGWLRGEAAPHEMVEVRLTLWPAVPIACWRSAT